MIWTFAPLFTIPVHIIPAKLSHYVFLFTKLSVQAKSHIKIRAAFVHMPISTVLAPIALLLDEILADFQVMTKVAPLAVRAKIIILEFLTCLDFGLVMGVGTAVSLLALAMYKLFANSICGQFGMVTRVCSLGNLVIISSLSIHLVIAFRNTRILLVSQMVVVFVWICHTILQQT